MEKRHYCVRCGSKQKAKYMYQIRVPDLKKNYWICYLCYKNQHIKPYILSEPIKLFNPTTGLKLD